MKKKPKSKRKSQHRRPPLSLLDKILYWSAFFLSLPAALVPIFLFEDLQLLIAFRDPTVIARADHASNFLAMPLLFYVEMSICIYVIIALECKYAIFPSPRIQYGKDPWDKNFYPLLDRRRRSVLVNPEEQRLRRKRLSVWCVGLLLCLFLVPFSFFGRDCLHEDNSIVSHNAVNRVSATYHEEDFSHLTLRTQYISKRGGGYWTYEMVIEMHNGHSFVFSNRDFGEKGEAHKELSLAKMLEIKALFSPNAITCKGIDNVDKVADDRALNESQTRQLHLLFGN